MEAVYRDLHMLRGCLSAGVEYTIKDIKDDEMSLKLLPVGETSTLVRGTQSKLEFHLN